MMLQVLCNCVYIYLFMYIVVCICIYMCTYPKGPKYL